MKQNKMSLEQAAKIIIEYEKGWPIPEKIINGAKEKIFQAHTKAKNEFKISKERIEKALPYGYPNLLGVIENLCIAGYIQFPKPLLVEIKEMERIKTELFEFARTRHHTTDHDFKIFCNGLIDKSLFEALESMNKYRSKSHFREIEKLKREIRPQSPLKGRDKRIISEYLKASERLTKKIELPKLKKSKTKKAIIHSKPKRRI